MQQPATSQSRHRVGKKPRQRVSRACDHCKAKKSRCTGIKPCAPCSALGLPCRFTAPYARGRPPTPPSEASPKDLSEHPVQDRGEKTATRVAYRRTAFSTSPHISTVEPAFPPYDDSSAAALQATTATAGGDRAVSNTPMVPEPETEDFADVITGQEGHYVGASCNVSFFSRLQRRLRDGGGGGAREGLTPQTSIFTSGDAPLPAFNPLSFINPSKAEATVLLNRYFDIGSPTYRYLDRPSVEQWLEDAYKPGFQQSPAKMAVLLVLFATAARYAAGTAQKTEYHEGVRYFQASELQLQDEKGPIELESIQARLGQCLFLLTCSRVNHCWSLFGTTSRLIIARGFHRRASKSKMTDPFMKRIEEECKRRLFWCSYNLDKYLGAMLGRPCVFHDEDIDQEYPSITVYNPDLGVSLPTEEPNRRILIAPVLHFKLVRIVSRALREMYSVRPPTQKRSAVIRRQLNDALKAWRKELPAFLDPDQVDARLLVPNFQRQSNMLSLAYSHAVILVNRGSLMNKLRKSDVSSDANGDEEDSNMKACLSAAMSILNNVDQIRRGGKILPAWWFTQYQAFCAVVIIYTYTIHAASSMDHETRMKHFEAAERCQAHIEAIAQDGTLAQRYFIVMEEFRLEAVDHMSRNKAKADGAISGPLGSSTPSTNLFTDEELIRVMNGFIDPGMSLGGMGLDEWPDLDGMDIGINDDMNEAVRF